MEYDLLIEKVGLGPEQYSFCSFKVQHRALTERQGDFEIWPAQMPELSDMSIRPIATLVLKRKLGFAEANRLKEACEKAWGKDARGLNYNFLPHP